MGEAASRPADAEDKAGTFEIPARAGGKPATTDTNPHCQTDQLPGRLFNDVLLEHVGMLAGITLGESLRSQPGSIGFFLEGDRGPGPDEAFMIGREFAHLHPAPEGSLHMTLPEEVRRAAMAADWAEPHPMAGRPTVSPQIVLVFAPRDEAELALVRWFVDCSHAYAKGEAPGPVPAMATKG